MRSRENATSLVPNGSISNPLCYPNKMVWGLKKSHKVAVSMCIFQIKRQVYTWNPFVLYFGEKALSIQNKGHLCPKYVHTYIYIYTIRSRTLFTNTCPSPLMKNDNSTKISFPKKDQSSRIRTPSLLRCKRPSQGVDLEMPQPRGPWDPFFWGELGVSNLMQHKCCWYFWNDFPYICVHCFGVWVSYVMTPATKTFFSPRWHGKKTPFL